MGIVDTIEGACEGVFVRLLHLKYDSMSLEGILLRVMVGEFAES